MTDYTLSHWGTYEVDREAGRPPRLKPYCRDNDPSPIGLHQLDDSVMALRVRRPAVRQSWLEHGPGARPELRGHEPFVEVEWSRAFALVAGELNRVRSKFGNAAIFGGSYGWASAGRFHHAQSQIHRFLNAIGGYVRHEDSYSLGAGRVVLPHIVAPMDELMASHTSWDVMAEHTKLFVTFGGVPSKNAQVNAGGVGQHHVPGGLRAMAAAGCRFVNFSPVRDNLNEVPAEWIPCRPGSDTAVMLALACTLYSEKRHDPAFLARCCTGFEVFEQYLSGAVDGVAKTPLWAEAISGVPASRIASLAREMAATRTMLNVAWALQRASHGEQPFWMVVTLAAMLGQIGKPGGGFGVGYGAANIVGSPNVRFTAPRLPQGKNRVDAFIPVARIADMLLAPGAPFTYNGKTYAYPDIKLIYWAGGNPFHHHQDLNRLLQAWQKPDSIIVNEQFWTTTAKHADVVLPTTTSMERNDIGGATLESVMVAMKPVIPAVGEALSDYEIFSGIAQRIGVADTFTEGRDEMEWLEYLYEASRPNCRQKGIELPSFADFWNAGLLDLGAHDRPVVMLEKFVGDPAAHPLRTPSGKIEIHSARIASFNLSDCPGHPVWREPKEWLGQGDGRLHLISDQPVRRLHSQLDASSFSRDGKSQGREPVWLNPADAVDRGIATGDIVELFNARGRCLAAACVSPDIMPGVARLSTGAWFDKDRESGVEKHGNPNALTLDAGASSLSQGCSAQTCLVEVRGPINDLPAVSAFDLPDFCTSDAAA